LNDIIALANNLVTVQVERGIRKKPELIDDCLRGNMSVLQVYLDMPKEMKVENQETINKIIESFGKMNPKHQTVKDYCEQILNKPLEQGPLITEL
jgi:endonuclease III